MTFSNTFYAKVAGLCFVVCLLGLHLSLLLSALSIAMNEIPDGAV